MITTATISNTPIWEIFRLDCFDCSTTRSHYMAGGIYCARLTESLRVLAAFKLGLKYLTATWSNSLSVTETVLHAQQRRRRVPFVISDEDSVFRERERRYISVSG